MQVVKLKMQMGQRQLFFKAKSSGNKSEQSISIEEPSISSDATPSQVQSANKCSQLVSC